MQANTTAAFHLSPQQRFSWESAPASRSRLVVRFEGPVDVMRLRNAVEKLVARHEILRTTYPRTTGVKTPFQVVGDSSCVDLTIGPDEFTIELPAMSADAVSLINIFREVAALYSAMDPGEVLQYADYSEWQNDLLQKDGPETEAAKNFWTAHTWDAVPEPILPFEGKTVSDARSVVALELVGTDADVLQAAWTILLWRLTGQSEIVIGRVVDGRTLAEFNGGFGLYAKVVPQYTSFTGEMSFGDVIRQVSSARTEAEAHQDFYRPGTTAESLKLGFSATKGPDSITLEGVTFSAVEIETRSPFSLELRCGLNRRAELIFDPARFSPAFVERMSRMLTILEKANSSLLAADLPILDVDERLQVLVSFNETTFDFPRDKCLQQLFEEQVARTPDLPVLRDENLTFSYSELNATANRLAHTLRARGVRASVPVGIMMERSAAMIAAMLGILKAGGCYLPLLPDHPKARLQHQLSETGAPVVLIDEKFGGLLPDFTGELIRFDDDLGTSSENPECHTDPEDLIYIMYTSGSTGTPKGVAVRHRNVVNYSWFLQHRTGGLGLNFATVSTLAADLGNTCIFPALVSGGCVHVVGYETAMSGELFSTYAATHHIDILKITPSHLAMLLESAGASILPRRFLISGGEALPWSLHQRIRKAGCAVINHYGPTEATIGCCMFDGESDVSQWAPATVPVGRPVGNARVYILDRFQPVPVGVAGELCVAGEGIAAGYFNQPGQTAERFVKNPFAASDELMYRTGDLARFLPTGDIEFLGRIDRQIKVRGFRVELAEIEAAIRRHPAVRQTAIATERDLGPEIVLVAYIVASSRIETAGWVSFLRDHIPDYMLPARFVTVEDIPLTPNGKVDFRALAALGQQTEDSSSRFDAPGSPEEEKMAAIWSEVLKTQSIGVNDNFFALGGHSLLATQIIARIRNGFGVQFPLHSFLESPTIAMVCSKLESFPKMDTEEDTIARLMSEIEGISEEEAEMLLKTMEGGGTA